MPIVTGSTRAQSTFLEMQDRVLAERFDATAYRTRVKRWLNDAAERIARRALVPGLREEYVFTAEIGEYRFTLPEDFARVEYLIPTDDPACGLDWVESAAEIRRQRLLTGRPTLYTIKSELIIAGVPTQAVELELAYQRLPLPMVEDDDVSELPESYVELLETYATARGYRSEEDQDLHDKWMADFESDLSRLKVDLQDTSNDGPDVVPGTF